jgi:putative endopeptidase
MGAMALAFGTARRFSEVSRRTVAPLAALALVVGIGCGGETAPSSIDFTAIDHSVDPCQDFYQHACGNWLATHPISPDGTERRRFDDAFYAMVPNFRRLLALDAGAASLEPHAQLIGDYDTSCLAAPSRPNARDLAASALGPVFAATSIEDLAAVMADLRETGVGTLFRMGVGVDPGAPTQNVLYLDQGGVELPERADYLDPTRADLRAAYREHIAALAAFFTSSATIDPDATIVVETALAQAAQDPAARRDPHATYNPLTIDELAAMSPTFPWATYFAKLGLGAVPRVVVTDPAYFTALDATLKATPLASLQSYVAWQVVQDDAPFLDQAVLDADFPFWAQEYTGETAPAPRDWTCMNATLSALGMAVSQSYVKDFVSPAVRTEAAALIGEIRASMGRHLTDAAWLDDPTRAEAMAKLDAMIQLVAYPDSWPTYDGLTITAESYLANRFALARFGQGNARKALMEPVRRDTWTMTPVTVNASYQLTNVIQFPAGILQLPFFAEGHSPASNYGGIGTVMGHEMTHGFDDDGRQFDGTGLLRDWWTPGVEAAFRDRSRCLVDQFSGYEALPGLQLDGALTLGENTADLGGIRVAYDALLAAYPQESARDGYDNRQQFFLAFAQINCANIRPERLSEAVMTDPHSPGPFRVNGTLVNVPEFAQAFGCPGAAPAVAAPAGRADICQVW